MFGLDETEAGEDKAPSAKRTDAALRPGANVGRYVLLEVVGRGAMGSVYAAYDPELDRRVALKVLHGKDGKRKGSRRERMLREAQAMARLSHPNVVSVFDVGTWDGGGEPRVFLAMEFIEGTTLDTWLQERDPPVEERIDVLAQAGLGLAAAHRAGLIHRDFKPANVLVTRNEDGSGWAVKVSDFGLVRGVGDTGFNTTGPHPTGPRSEDGDEAAMSLRLTRTGAYLGTPAYMAAEQFLRRELDPRTDQFAFCVTAYETLYRARPFPGRGFHELMASVIEGRVSTPSSDVNVPRHVAATIRRGLSPDPADRFPSMDALLAELRRTSKRGTAMIGGLLVGFGVLAGAAAVWADDLDDACPPPGGYLPGVWDDEARSAVESAIRASSVAHSEATWAAVHGSLDAWAEQWTAVSEPMCRGTAVIDPALVPRRDQCLADRRRAALALVNVLRDPDETTLENAVSAAAALPSPQDCVDFDYLASTLVIPPSANLDEIARLEESVARRSALIDSGQYKAAKDGLDSELALARSIDYPPTVARLELLSARIATDASRFDEGISLATQAYQRAGAIGADELAADAARRIARVHINDRHALDLGRAWLLQVDMLSTRAHLPERFVLRTQMARAELATESGELDEAIAILQDVAQRNRALRGGDLLALEVEHRLATALYRQGDAGRAGAHAETSLAAARELFGDSHPRTVAALSSVGALALSANDHERGKALLFEVLEAETRTHDAPTALSIQAHANLAVAFSLTESWNEARTHFDEALRGGELVYGSEHSHVAGTLQNYASFELVQGDLERAYELSERARNIAETSLEEDNPRMVGILRTSAAIARRRGQPEVAEQHAQQALKIAKARGMDNVVPEILIQTGSAAAERHDYATARRWLEQARDAAEQLDDLAGHIEALARLAFVHESTGDLDRARAALDQAKALLPENHLTATGAIGAAVYYYELAWQHLLRNSAPKKSALHAKNADKLRQGNPLVGEIPD